MGGGVFLPRRILLLVAALLTLTAGEVGAAPATERAWIGVQMMPAADGVLVRRVAEPSPARDAELSDGDLLIAMDGVRLTQPQQLAQAVARSQPGAKLKLRLRRGSSESDKTIELGVHPGEGEVMRRLLVGRAAPDLGNTITVQGVIDEQASKWRGNVVVLEFWASWCVSCKALAPDLARWHRSWASRGLKLIGIASDQPALAHEATKSWAIPYPVVADPAEQSAAGYAVSAFPTLVVIDRAGVVRDVMIGYDQKRRAEIERVVELLLAH